MTTGFLIDSAIEHFHGPTLYFRRAWPDERLWFGSYVVVRRIGPGLCNREMVQMPSMANAHTVLLGPNGARAPFLEPDARTRRLAKRYAREGDVAHQAHTTYTPAPNHVVPPSYLAESGFVEVPLLVEDGPQGE